MNHLTGEKYRMWMAIVEDIARSFHEPERGFCVDWLVVGSVASVEKVKPLSYYAHGQIRKVA